MTKMARARLPGRLRPQSLDQLLRRSSRIRVVALIKAKGPITSAHQVPPQLTSRDRSICQTGGLHPTKRGQGMASNVTWITRGSPRSGGCWQPTPETRD